MVWHGEHREFGCFGFGRFRVIDGSKERRRGAFVLGLFVFRWMMVVRLVIVGGVMCGRLGENGV